MSEPSEEYEHVPWSQLEPALRSSPRMLFAFGIVAAVAVGFVAARLLSGTPPAPSPSGATLPTPTMAAAEQSTSSTTSVPAPQIYREADLLAVLPDEETRMATMRAEWFVTDYFTVDGDGLEGGQSYVEWARTFRVDGSEAGRYLVGVAFRMLASEEEGSFVRLPLQAVEVVVVHAGDGTLAVGDLPRPIEPPRPGRAPAWPEGEEVPATVAVAALSHLAELGIDGEVVAGHETGAGWRVVVQGARGGGPVFPLVVTVGGGAVTP